MQITRRSRFTGQEHTMDLPITQEHIDAWSGGALIQEAMPHLTPSQREFLLTGTTQEEWDAAFPPDEDDDEGEGD